MANILGPTMGDTRRQVQRTEYDADCEHCWLGEPHTLAEHDEQLDSCSWEDGPIEEIGCGGIILRGIEPDEAIRAFLTSQGRPAMTTATHLPS